MKCSQNLIAHNDNQEEINMVLIFPSFQTYNTLKEETFVNRNFPGSANTAKFLYFADINFRRWPNIRYFGNINFHGQLVLIKLVKINFRMCSLLRMVVVTKLRGHKLLRKGPKNTKVSSAKFSSLIVWCSNK